MDLSSQGPAVHTPSLSVVIVVFGGTEFLPRSLSALLDQRLVPGLDLVVPYDDDDAGLSQLRQEFPGVRFLHFPGRRTLAELRALGIRESRGPVVALTESHCTPAADWCAQVLEAHKAPYAAIGWAVERFPDTALNWALYLCDYARYMNPLREGPAHSLTDCNVSYKRSDLDAIAESWDHEFHENVVHSELAARGKTLWRSPRVVVFQQRRVRFWEALQDRYAFGRLFGSTRVSKLRWDQRLFLACCTVVLPLLLVARVAGHVLRAGRVRESLRSFPLLGVLISAWAWGELVGYLTGRADGPFSSVKV